MKLLQHDMIRCGLTIALALSVSAAFGSGCKAGEENTSTSSGTSSGGDGAGALGPGSGGSGGGFAVSGSGGADTCHTESAAGERKELDILVVLDRSLSMTGTLWDGSVAALTQFFQDSASAGIRSAIGFFPPESALDACDPNIYNPPAVPLAALPTSAQTLIDAMGATAPAGDFTPTHGALYGSLQWAQLHQDDNPDRIVVVVFASDGDPTECDTNIASIAQIASTARAYNGLRTYTVAIAGATVANLDQVAAAGGTQAALDITNDIMLFQEKMEEIRGEVLGCEFDVPQPTNGEFDPARVNVDLAPDGQTEPDTIPQVADESECGDQPGWYYENPASANKIVLCPASCAVVQNNPEAKVDFAFGCPTIVK